MTMRMYASSDSGAPTLQGVVGGAYSGGWADGSLLNLLDKCLVTGYGSQSGAGWLRSFTGTSKGVFRQGAGCGFYMRCLDDGSLTAGAREAGMRGSETAADVDLTGATQTFPTAASLPGGVLLRKSDTADTVQRPWLLFADNRTFYVFPQPIVSGAYLAGFMFGDFTSYKPGDLFNCMIAGRIVSAAVDNAANEWLDKVGMGTSVVSGVTGHFAARGYNAIGNAVGLGKTGSTFQAGNGQVGMGTSGLAFPNPTDQLMYLSRAFVLDSTGPTPNVRGYMRGFWVLQHATGLVPFDYTFAGAGGLAGRTFKKLGLGSASGCYTMETSDTWS